MQIVISRNNLVQCQLSQNGLAQHGHALNADIAPKQLLYRKTRPQNPRSCVHRVAR